MPGGIHVRTPPRQTVPQRPQPSGAHSCRVRVAGKRGNHASRRRPASDRADPQARPTGVVEDDATDRGFSGNRRSDTVSGARALTRYLLDTNIISDLMRSPRGTVAKRIAKVGEDNICTSIIVAAELRYGCAKSGSKKLLAAVEELLAEIDVLPFDVPADAEYGGIRAGLEAVGKTIGGNDLLIAAHARSIGAVIVTANADEFKRIRGLKVENWLA